MKKFSVQQFGILMLAGGASSRMGQPKQLMAFEGQTLVRHAAWTALGSLAEYVVVVTGANHTKVSAQLVDLPLSIVVNRQWEQGMASSVSKGIQFAVGKKAPVDGIIIMSCDQPFVTPALLNNLVAKQQEIGLPVITSVVGEQKTAPALFHSCMFGELMELPADTGLKTLLARHPQITATVPFAMGIFDVDTMQDYQNLQQNV